MELKLKTNPKHLNENGELIRSNNNISEYENSYNAASNMTIAEKRDYYDDLDVNEPMKPTLTMESLEELTRPEENTSLLSKILIMVCVMSTILFFFLGAIYLLFFIGTASGEKIVKNSTIKMATVSNAESVKVSTHKKKTADDEYYETKWTQVVMFSYEDSSGQMVSNKIDIEINKKRDFIYKDRYTKKPSYTGAEYAPKYRVGDQFEVYVNKKDSSKVYDKNTIDSNLKMSDSYGPLLKDIVIFLFIIGILSFIIDVVFLEKKDL